MNLCSCRFVGVRVVMIVGMVVFVVLAISPYACEVGGEWRLGVEWGKSRSCSDGSLAWKKGALREGSAC